MKIGDRHETIDIGRVDWRVVRRPFRTVYIVPADSLYTAQQSAADRFDMAQWTVPFGS